MIEIDVVLSKCLLVCQALQISRISRRAAEINDVLWLCSYRPLEHIAVDRQVGGNGQRVAFDRGSAADDGG